MGMWQVQSTLNRGELEPKIAGRIDLEQYYQGVATAENVVCIPQGGLTKRPGQQYIGETINANRDARIEEFAFSVDDHYLLVFLPAFMQIYKDDVLQTNINGSGDDYLPIPWNGIEITEFDYIQSADTIIITHPDEEPRKITRSDDTTWTLTAALETDDIPFFDYDDPSSPSESAEQQQLVFVDATEGDRIKLSFNGYLTDDIVYDSTDNALSFANDIQKELNGLPSILRGTVSVVVGGTPLVIVVTFLGQAADRWELIKATPVSVKEVLTWSCTAFRLVVGVTRQERVWSTTRGWPATCTFHEGRLWFGGSKQLPNVIWGSYVHDYFKFLPDKGYDDEPRSATLQTDQINTITAIYSNRSLQIFTAGAEFYVRDSPITPENIAVQRQTNLGSKRIRPVTIDGITLFLQRTGKALYQFLFVDEVQANTSSSISILAPHLIKNPGKMAVKRGSATNDANYVYLLNDDGTITVFNTLTSEAVAGFTRWEGTGHVESIAVVNNILYMLVLRVIDGNTVIYIEKENPDYNLDSVVYTTGSDLTTITGLDHLEGETVKVKADGAVRDDAVVSSGEITIDPAADEIEVGFDFNPLIKTMPMNVQGMKGGPHIALKKRILRAAINIFESNGVILNGQRIADRTIGVNQFDAPEPISGIQRMFLPGWSIEAQLTITQNTPYGFTILNIANEVKT